MILGPEGMPIAGSANASVRGVMRNVGARQAAMMNSENDLPAGYHEVNYITPSSKGVYINLGWYPTEWTVFEAMMTFPGLSCASFGLTDTIVLGRSYGFYCANNWANDRWLGYRQNNTMMYNNGYTSNYKEILDNIHHHSVNYNLYIHRKAPELQSSEYFVDGNVMSTGWWGATFPSDIYPYEVINLDMYLFAINCNGRAYNAGASKIGRIKFTDSRGVVANFIPCINNDNVAGMYNVLDRTFHTGANGNIIYGGVI